MEKTRLCDLAPPHQREPGHGLTQPSLHLLAQYCNHVASFHSRDVLLEEVYADGLLVVLGEDALAVALYHARLAHRPVPHYHNLEGEEEDGEMKLDDDGEG